MNRIIPFKVHFENGTPSQRAAVMKSLELAHEQLGTEEFRLRVQNFVQDDGTPGFYQASPPNDVYYILMDSSWKYSVRFYSKRLTTANAYVNPGDPTVNLNWAKMASFHPAEIANTLVHECTHLHGFDHDYERTPKRKFSVPYAVGQIVEDLILGVRTIGVKVEPDTRPNRAPRKPWWSRLLFWL